MKIDWYGPPEGERSTAHSVTYTTPVAREVRRVAIEMAHNAAGELAMHYETGDAKIGVVHRNGTAMGAGEAQWIDSIVYLKATNDEGIESRANDNGIAAASINKRFGILEKATGWAIRNKRTR